MEFEYLESQKANHTTFMYDTIYFQAPGSEDDDDMKDDEEDEDFDDLHEVQVDDEINEPDGEKYDITNPDPDDDHLPDDDLQ